MIAPTLRGLHRLAWAVSSRLRRNRGLDAAF